MNNLKIKLKQFIPRFLYILQKSKTKKKKENQSKEKKKTYKFIYSV